MKKVIALLLALLLIFSLAACGSGSSSTSSSASAKTSASASASTSADTSAESANNSDRDPFELVYMCGSFSLVWCKNVETAMKSLQNKYNFTLYSTDYNSDNELCITNVETYCDQGVDGFIMDCGEDIAYRAWEITNEYGIPWITESTCVRDESGVLQTAGVELNAYAVGVDIGKWIVENYKEHFGITGDVDQSKVGFINPTYSVVYSFRNRCAGAKDQIVAALPNCQVFEPDLVVEGTLTADAAYNEISPIMAAHPEINYWLITCIIDDWGLGAARCAESLGITNKVLVASAGGEALTLEWDNGYDSDGTGCWKMCDYYEAMDFVEVLVPGMIDVLEGKTTLENLWPDYHEEGSNYSAVQISGKTAMRDNYKSLIKMEYN